MLSLNFHIFVEEVMWLIVFYYSVFTVTLLAIAVSVQLLANCQVLMAILLVRIWTSGTLNKYNVSFHIHFLFYACKRFQ